MPNKFPSKITQRIAVANDRRAQLINAGQKLRMKLQKGPSVYFLDKNGSVHFVKKSAGAKAVSKLGWKEIDYLEDYRIKLLGSQNRKKLSNLTKK